MSFLLALMLVASPMAPPAVVSGTASWYADAHKAQGSYYAAMPGYRWGHPFYVTIHPYGSATPRIRVRVSDFCRCPGRVIDLSWRLFTRFAPLTRGLTRVVIER